MASVTNAFGRPSAAAIMVYADRSMTRSFPHYAAFISISSSARAAACVRQTGRLWHQFRVVLVVGNRTFVSTKSDYTGPISGSQGHWAIAPRSPGTHAMSRAAAESRMFFLFGAVVCFIRWSSHRLRENACQSELKCMCYTYPCHLQRLHSSPRCL